MHYVLAAQSGSGISADILATLSLALQHKKLIAQVVEEADAETACKKEVEPLILQLSLSKTSATYQLKSKAHNTQIKDAVAVLDLKDGDDVVKGKMSDFAQAVFRHDSDFHPNGKGNDQCE